MARNQFNTPRDPSMSLYNSINTPSYTTSTTNMYNKDRFHALEAALRIAATQRYRPKTPGFYRCVPYAHWSDGGRRRFCSGSSQTTVAGLGICSGLVSTTRWWFWFSFALSAAGLNIHGRTPENQSNRKKLVLIILVIVFKHKIKIQKYMFVYIQQSKLYEHVFS